MLCSCPIGRSRRLCEPCAPHKAAATRGSAARGREKPRGAGQPRGDSCPCPLQHAGKVAGGGPIAPHVPEPTAPLYPPSLGDPVICRGRLSGAGPGEGVAGVSDGSAASPVRGGPAPQPPGRSAPSASPAPQAGRAGLVPLVGNLLICPGGKKKHEKFN